MQLLVRLATELKVIVYILFIQTRGIYPISKFLSNSFPCNSNKLERIV